MTNRSYLLKYVDRNVRTVWVKDWAVEFLKGLDGQLTKPEIEQYCQGKLQEFSEVCKTKAEERAKEDRQTFNEHSWKQSSTSYMSGIRKAITDWSKDKTLDESNSYPQQTKDGIVTQHLALLYMKYEFSHNQPNTEAKQTKKDEQRRNLESINCVDEYQAKIDVLLQSIDHKELVAGLIAATGRRPSEIYRTAEFKQVGQFEVMFTGQLKTRGEEREAYPTYTLVESNRVVDALARLRRMPEIKELKKLTLAEIDSGKNNKMNAAIKEHFSPLINPPHGEAELSAKNLRASYAAIAIYLFCPWTTSTNLFIKERLGHTSDATATAYEDYQITDQQRRPLTRGAWVQRLTENMDKPMHAEIVNMQMRVSAATRAVIDDQEFLPFGDRVNRLEELVRLARIGKQFEEGKLVKEIVTVVEKPVERIVEVVVESPTATVTEQTEVEPSTKTKQPKKDLTEMTNEELFGSHSPNTGLEKIRRAVQAIKTYNERQYSIKDMWMINTSTLKELTNCRTAVVEKYLKSDEGRLQVNDYNLEKQMGYQHNRGKGKITDVVKLG
ncbi:hypothetical protein HW132_28870 [Brasilonema sp. CT11]|nr:hypothetical protein [Brasilonema sp. CT11]